MLGGEGRGLHRLVREACDQLASLPLRGPVSSLNVSVAAGVVLYEAVRQRGTEKRQASVSHPIAVRNQGFSGLQPVVRGGHPSK